MNERTLFLPVGGKAPHPLLLPLGNVKIAVGADGEAGGGVELSVDYHACLELALRRRGRQVQREDAAAARGADVERLAVQDQVHGRLERAPGNAGQQLPGLHIEDLHCVGGFVRHVQMLPVYDDAAHRVAWHAVLVKHHLETQRRWHIERRVVTVLRKAPVAGRDERAGEKPPIGILLAEVRGHRCGFAGFGHKRHHGVRILAGDVDATIVPQLHVEGVHHRRNLRGFREHLLEAEDVTVPVVAGNVAILAPRVRDVEVVAHQSKAARNVQRMRSRRWIEQQRMYLARRAVVLEDADVVDAVPRFTSIADPPRVSVLPNTIAASSEPARR
jgi:hypothetical protein